MSSDRPEFCSHPTPDVLSRVVLSTSSVLVMAILSMGSVIISSAVVLGRDCADVSRLQSSSEPVCQAHQQLPHHPYDGSEGVRVARPVRRPVWRRVAVSAAANGPTGDALCRWARSAVSDWLQRWPPQLQINSAETKYTAGRRAHARRHRRRHMANWTALVICGLIVETPPGSWSTGPRVGSQTCCRRTGVGDYVVL